MRGHLETKQILVVEDDEDIADLVAHHLRQAGYLTRVVNRGEEVLSVVRSDPPDLMVLDLMLPTINGLEICRAIRSSPETASLPIIMLTAKSEEADRVVGLEVGGDDYVTKPFSPKELVARVGAVLRRSTRGVREHRTLRIGPLAIDADRHVVLLDGVEVTLTAKEFLLLKYLKTTASIAK